jgi:hypothetical protein
VVTAAAVWATCTKKQAVCFKRGHPQGWPLCVHLGQELWVPGCLTYAIASNISFRASPPQCDAALDHIHSSASLARPARTGFNSV